MEYYDDDDDDLVFVAQPSDKTEMMSDETIHEKVSEFLSTINLNNISLNTIKTSPPQRVIVATDEKRLEDVVNKDKDLLYNVVIPVIESSLELHFKEKLGIVGQKRISGQKRVKLVHMQRNYLLNCIRRHYELETVDNYEDDMESIMTFVDSDHKVAEISKTCSNCGSDNIFIESNFLVCENCGFSVDIGNQLQKFKSYSESYSSGGTKDVSDKFLGFKLMTAGKKGLEGTVDRLVAKIVAHHFDIDSSKDKIIANFRSFAKSSYNPMVGVEYNKLVSHIINSIIDETPVKFYEIQNLDDLLSEFNVKDAGEFIAKISQEKLSKETSEYSDIFSVQKDIQTFKRYKDAIIVYYSNNKSKIPFGWVINDGEFSKQQTYALLKYMVSKGLFTDLKELPDNIRKNCNTRIVRELIDKLSPKTDLGKLLERKL